MLFLIYYVVAIAVLILHFIGVLERHNLEWTVAHEYRVYCTHSLAEFRQPTTCGS